MPHKIGFVWLLEDIYCTATHSMVWLCILNIVTVMRLVQWEHNLKGLDHRRLHVPSLVVTWLECVDCFSVMVLTIACAKRSSTNNPSIIEVSGALYSYPVHAASKALEWSHHLFPTWHHRLTLKPRDCVKLLIEITLTLLKCIKLNV